MSKEYNYNILLLGKQPHIDATPYETFGRYLYAGYLLGDSLHLYTKSAESGKWIESIWPKPEPIKFTFGERAVIKGRISTASKKEVSPPAEEMLPHKGTFKPSEGEISGSFKSPGKPLEINMPPSTFIGSKISTGFDYHAEELIDRLNEEGTFWIVSENDQDIVKEIDRSEKNLTEASLHRSQHAFTAVEFMLRMNAFKKLSGAKIEKIKSKTLPMTPLYRAEISGLLTTIAYDEPEGLTEDYADIIKRRGESIEDLMISNIIPRTNKLENELIDNRFRNVLSDEVSKNSVPVFEAIGAVGIALYTRASILGGFAAFSVFSCSHLWKAKRERDKATAIIKSDSLYFLNEIRKLSSSK